MKLYLTAITLFITGFAMAQQELEEQVTELKEKSDKFNVYLNFQSSLDALTEKEKDTQLGFKTRQLRLEFRGDINERIFYRLRHRLNKSNQGTSLDNLAKATDMMYAGFRLDEKWTITAGKMCQTWGGFEFDLNPMNIYEYSEFIEYMDNFMLGGMLTYAPNENHELNLQITNSRNDKLEAIYNTNTGRPRPAGVNPSNSPLTYIFNWNGNFFDKKFQTRWAVGLETEAKNKYSKMVTLGNKLNLNKFQVFLDYMFAHQDLDRLYLSGNGTTFEDVSYHTFILKPEYQFSEKWNVFMQGIFETASVDGKSAKKSYGYYTGIEYMPFSDQDLRFFAAYVGKKYDFESSGVDTYSNRFSIGMMYRIKAF